MRLVKRSCVLAGSVLTLMAPCAYASPDVLPGNADPGRVLEDRKALPEPERPSPQVVIPLLTETPAPKQADSVGFVLSQVVIEGSTVYSHAELEQFTKETIGHRITLAKLYEIASTITSRYHDDGYALSRAVVPPQQIEGGVVTIRVIEGGIASVETQGSYPGGRTSEAIIERIRHYRPLKVSALEHDMLLLDDVSGMSVQAVLKPAESKAATQPDAGAVGLVLIFNDTPQTSSIGFDNAGSRYVGPYQLGFQTGFNHFPLANQQLSLSGLVTSPLNNLQTVSATQRIALSSEGTFLTLQGSYAHTEPGYRLTPEQLESDSFDCGMTLMHTVLRSRAQSLYLSTDMAAKDIVTEALQSRLYDDRLRVLGLSTDYDFLDSWGGSNIAQAKLSQGLDLLGATRTGTFNLSRANGHSDFTKVTANLSRLQRINDHINLYVAAEGQFAWSPLLSSEQFGFGGQQFGRAYDPSELTADNGVAALAELRYDLTPVSPKISFELFTFYDIGHVWNYRAVNDSESAASAGLGIRFGFGEHVSGTLTLAQPLTHRVAAPDYGNGKDPRGFLSLIARF